MSKTVTLRIATRKSRLALWQAEHVAARLGAAHPGIQVSLVPMTTKGDRILDRSLAKVGGKGLFIKELELAMANGRAEIAVHSMKDVPAELPPGMSIPATLERADPRDALVSNRFGSLDALPRGARVGTSSLRRQCQLRHHRPDLEVVPLRGNLDTRLRRLEEAELDAIILAAAGLKRLGLEGEIRELIAPELCLPAVGQGVLGIECLDGNTKVRALLSPLTHHPTYEHVLAERAFSSRLGGSCQSPIAAYAESAGDRLRLRGLVGLPDGTEVLAGEESGSLTEAEALGRSLAERLLADGAERLLAIMAGE